MADNKQPVAAPVSRPKVRSSATPSRTDATRTVQRLPVVPAGVSAAKPIDQGATRQSSARHAMLPSPPQSPVAPQSRVAVGGLKRAPHAGRSSVAASHHKNEATFPRLIQFDYTKFLNGILRKLEAKLEATLHLGRSTDYDGKDGLNEAGFKFIAIACLQSLPELQDWGMTSELRLEGGYADLVLRHGNKAALVIELKYVRATFVKLYLRSGQVDCPNDAINGLPHQRRVKLQQWVEEISHQDKSVLHRKMWENKNGQDVLTIESVDDIQHEALEEQAMTKYAPRLKQGSPIDHRFSVGIERVFCVAVVGVAANLYLSEMKELR
ncbi:hypothetical protein HK405_015517 [Cladochytrium tenue]|nr:hypothetical protein HK405_015517 [Cladochytrium tenue]